MPREDLIKTLRTLSTFTSAAKLEGFGYSPVSSTKVIYNANQNEGKDMKLTS